MNQEIENLTKIIFVFLDSKNGKEKKIEKNLEIEFTNGAVLSLDQQKMYIVGHRNNTGVLIAY